MIDAYTLPEPPATVAGSAGAPGLRLHDHGPHHWKCVAMTGLQLAVRDPAIDMLTVYVFAQLHDSGASIGPRGSNAEWSASSLNPSDIGRWAKRRLGQRPLEVP